MSNVTFLVDGIAVGISSNAPYSIVWTVKRQRMARMEYKPSSDMAGNQATSGNVTVITRNPVPDTTPQSVSLGPQ